MIRKAFPLLLVVAGVIGLLGLSSVFAQQAGPSRDLPADPVAQGEKFTVTITDTGYGADREIGQVVETLPAGFSYVDGSATKVVGHATKGVVRGTVDATDSRIVTFSVVSVESFTYEVMVGDSVGDGDHTFSGAGGDDTITVEGGTTTPPDMTASPVATTPPDTTTPGGLSRELPTGPVAQGEKFTVTITDTEYGADREIGQVVETLPAGFSYVDGSATKVVGHATKGVVRGTVDATDSRIVTFSVVSVESFTYEVMVGDSVGDGDHTFSGAGGDDTITVEAGDETTTPEPDTTTTGDTRPLPEPTAGRYVDLPGPGEVPDLPGPGEVPDLPGPREIPAIPAIPDLPGPGEVPDLPGPRAIPGIPGIPDLPGPRAIPGIPDLPGPRAIPGIPDLPGPRAIPGIPDLPGPRAIPGIPDLPGPRAIPGIPDLPGPRAIPGIPDLPGPRAIPGIPDLPGPRAIPGIPVPASWGS